MQNGSIFHDSTTTFGLFSLMKMGDKRPGEFQWKLWGVDVPVEISG
jgi:hypothetical protein